MFKMSSVVVLVTVLLLVVCAETAGSKRKQVSTTLKMTAQRNDTGVWTAQFGDYEMVIEHRHFGKPTEGPKQQDGTWTMKLKHTVTVFPEAEDADDDDEDFTKDDTSSSQRTPWGDYEKNEVKNSGIRFQRKWLGKLDALSKALREINPKTFGENVHPSETPVSVDPLESVGKDEPETFSNNHLPDDGNPASPRSSYEQEENEEETKFDEDQGTPEVSYIPRFEALRSPAPEDDTHVESAQIGRTAAVPLSVHQHENNSALDEEQTSNQSEENRAPTLSQRIHQEPVEVIERTVGLSQRRVQDSPADHQFKEAKKRVTVNQERMPTDTQLEVPLNRGDPSIWRNPSPWPTLTSTYENQQRPMTSDVAYDDVEAESAAAAEQEEDEDDWALAHEKKLIMERFPRSRSLPPYNMGYEHYPGVGWLKLNTSYWQWPEARKACEAEGAHLAVPNSERKVRIFQEIMGRHSYVVERAVLKNQVYVGVYTPDRYRRFTTVLGEPFHPGFSIWFDNEPNNADPGEECVTLHVMGRIRDVPCFYNLPFLCEIREH